MHFSSPIFKMFETAPVQKISRMAPKRGETQIEVFQHSSFLAPETPQNTKKSKGCKILQFWARAQQKITIFTDFGFIFIPHFHNFKTAPSRVQN